MKNGTLTCTLTKLDAVTKKLQSGSIHMADARNRYENVTENYPIAKNYLSYDSEIVHNPEFESVIIGILVNRE